MVGMQRASMPVVGMSPSNLSSMHSLEAASCPCIRHACPSWVSCWVSSPIFNAPGRRRWLDRRHWLLSVCCSQRTREPAILAAGNGRQSLFFLQERVGDFFASVHGGDDDEQGTACDDEAEFAVSDVAILVCGG